MRGSVSVSRLFITVVTLFALCAVTGAQENPFRRSAQPQNPPDPLRSFPTQPQPGSVIPDPLAPVQPNIPLKADLSAIIEGIQDFYDEAAGIEAYFRQESTIKSLNKAQSARGKVYFKKPGKMAWIYEEPTNQKIISDGLHLWLYLPQNRQVIKNRTNQAFATETPNNFLSGLGDIKRDFTVRFASPMIDENRNYLLEFVPKKPQVSWTKIFATAKPILYNGQTLYHLIQTTIYDRFGNMNKITFTNLNSYSSKDAYRISDAMFVFLPPAGVQIIEPPASLRAR